MVRTHYVLIDLENVSAGDLTLLNRTEVRLLVFIGSNQQKIPSNLAIQMQAMGDRAEYVQICGNGPNALDFHIAFTIGEKLCSGSPSTFHVISKDKGFDPLLAYLKQKKILAYRYESLSEMPFLKAIKLKSSDERVNLVIEKLMGSKATRPRTTKTLANAIKAMLSQQLTEEEVTAIIQNLEAQKLITVTDDKVSYSAKMSP